MIDIRNNAKRQEYEANTSLVIIQTSKVENKMAGCLLDSREIVVAMYINDRYKEQRKAAEMYIFYNFKLH